MDAARAALGALDAPHLVDRRLGTLSGGERQRAVLARAVAQDASLLLLDEPTSALDVGAQQQVLELVASLRSERDLTVLSAMHDLTLAGQYADRLVLLDGGREVASGAPADVLTEELIARHYGASVRVVDGEEGRPSCPSARGSTRSARCPDGAHVLTRRRPQRQVHARGPARVGVERPDRVRGDRRARGTTEMDAASRRTSPSARRSGRRSRRRSSSSAGRGRAGRCVPRRRLPDPLGVERPRGRVERRGDGGGGGRAARWRRPRGADGGGLERGRARRRSRDAARPPLPRRPRPRERGLRRGGRPGAPRRRRRALELR